MKFFKPGDLLKYNETALTFLSLVEELQNRWWKPAQAIMIEWGWPCQGSKPLPSEFVAEVWSIIIITSDSEESIQSMGIRLKFTRAKCQDLSHYANRLRCEKKTKNSFKI